jgi:16S rRNA (guanine527-N7)-methyltransferase
MARPDWQVVVLDSNHKKGAFLQQAANELVLPNVEAVTARIEDYRPAARFDVVISRAFSDLATMARASLPHLAPGGCIAAMKGVMPREEMARLPAGVRVVATIPLTVPGVDAERHLVMMAAA